MKKKEPEIDSDLENKPMAARGDRRGKWGGGGSEGN